MTSGGGTSWLQCLARKKVGPEHLRQRREQRLWVSWPTSSSSSSNLCQRLDVVPELLSSRGHKDRPLQNVISMCMSTKTWWSGPCLTLRLAPPFFFHAHTIRLDFSLVQSWTIPNV